MSTDTEPTIAEPARSFDPDALRDEVPRGARQAPARRRQRPVRRDGGRVRPLPRRSLRRARSSARRSTDEVDVVVIGGGFGGLLAGARLREAGVDDIRIIEKGGDFGGTWYWNRYPGAMCDVESYIYLPLLEEVGYIPTEKYARAPEILAHSRAIGEHFDLYRDACFQTEVTELRWDDDDAALDRHDQPRRRDARPLRRAWRTGRCTVRSCPGIPGIETFKGHTFHTSRWDYDYTGGDSDGEPHGPARQARRHHRHRRHRGAVRAAPRRGGRAALRLPAHAVVDRRARQPPDRSGVGGEPASRAGSSSAWTTSTPSSRAASQDEDLVNDGWTDIIGKLLVMMRSADEAGELTRREPRRRTMELADFEKMEQIRARVDDDRATTRRPPRR